MIRTHELFGTRLTCKSLLASVEKKHKSMIIIYSKSSNMSHLRVGAKVALQLIGSREAFATEKPVIRIKYVSCVTFIIHHISLTICNEKVFRRY